MMNKISVIVPVYNLKDYICRCIESILGQTHTDLEIIIVDDGSNDGSDVVVDELAEGNNRVKVIHNEHIGALQARIAGAKAAIGNWIAFVDGDDTLEPEMYERLLDNALKYDADISHCGYVKLHINGSSVKYYDSGEIVLQDSLDVLGAFAKNERIEWWSLCNKIYNRKLLTLELFERFANVSVESNEDLLMNYLLIRGSDRLIYEDRCWYRYNQRVGSATDVDSISKILDRIYVKKMMRDWAPRDLYDMHQAEYLRMCISAYTYLYRKKKEEEILEKLRGLILAEKDSVGLLDEKTATMADLIINCDCAYRIIVSNIERQKR